jgi:hypothetical protein
MERAERDEIAKKVETIVGILKFQVLMNLDELVAPLVRDGVINKDALEQMVKRPVMQAVTRLQSLHLVTQNPGFERKGETSQ